MTPYLEDKLIGTLFGQPFAVPDLWLGLTDAGVEVSGANYSRLPIKPKLTKKAPVTNTDKLEFPIHMNDWGTVDGAAIYDAPKGGNCLWPCELPLQRAIPGRRIVILPGQLKLSLRKSALI